MDGEQKSRKNYFIHGVAAGVINLLSGRTGGETIKNIFFLNFGWGYKFPLGVDGEEKSRNNYFIHGHALSLDMFSFTRPRFESQVPIFHFSRKSRNRLKLQNVLSNSTPTSARNAPRNWLPKILTDYGFHLMLICCYMILNLGFI